MFFPQLYLGMRAEAGFVKITVQLIPDIQRVITLRHLVHIYYLTRDSLNDYFIDTFEWCTFDVKGSLGVNPRCLPPFFSTPVKRPGLSPIVTVFTAFIRGENTCFLSAIIAGSKNIP